MNNLNWVVLYGALLFSSSSFANPPAGEEPKTSSVKDKDLSPASAKVWLQAVRNARSSAVNTGETADSSASRRRGGRPRSPKPSNELKVSSVEPLQFSGSETSYDSQLSTYPVGTRHLPDGALRTELARRASSAIDTLSSKLVEKFDEERAFLALGYLVLRDGNLNDLTEDADSQLIRLAIENKLADLAAEIIARYGMNNLIRLMSTFPEFEWKTLLTFKRKLSASGCRILLTAQ